MRGIQTKNANVISVVIDSAGQLGTASSSERFKKDIKPMEKGQDRSIRDKAGKAGTDGPPAGSASVDRSLAAKADRNAHCSSAEKE